MPPHGSKYSTSSELIKTGGGRLHGITLTPAAAKSTVTVYDNTAGSGTILCKLQAAADGASAPSGLPDGGIPFSIGLWVELSGTGAVATTVYD